MVENVDHNDGQYALALQFGDYRRACWFAIRAVRRTKRKDDLWIFRVCETFRRRNS